jgi:hypothetical protein
LTLIELDRAASPSPPASHAPPAERYRIAGLLLAALLLLASGGAAPPGRLHWRHLGGLPAPGAPEAAPQLDGDRTYTVSRAGGQWTVGAWQLAEPPSRLWTAHFPARDVGPDQVAFGDVRVRRAGPVVLLSDGPATTVVDARTGALRWDSPIPVQPLAGDHLGLVQDTQFRAGTRYDQESGDPGPLYFSAAGEPHTEPPITTEVRAVDLRTGTTVWSASLPGSVEVFPGAGLLVLAADRLSRRSPDTGAVLGETPLPVIGGQRPSFGQLVGDVLLVAYGEVDSGNRRLVGYAADTLRRLWTRPEARALVSPGRCDGVVCLDTPSGRTVLDPATGRPLWSVPAGVDLTRHGPGLVEVGGSPDPAMRLVDPVTGVERLDLAGWRGEVPGSGGEPVLVRRPVGSGASTFAAAGGDPATLRVLGTTRGPVGDCSADEQFVVCQAAGELQVFAYRG